MFDGFLADCRDKDFATRLQKLTNLDLKTVTDENGVWIRKYTKFNGLTINIYPSNYICLTGSLHKFDNLGEHNYNDFYKSRVRQAIDCLGDSFDIDPGALTLHNLEFGFNIITPFRPEVLISNLVAYKSKQLSNLDYGIGKTCHLTQYKLKIYDKGAQFGREEPILRIELKMNRMRMLTAPIVNLNDLLIDHHWTQCYEQVKAAFNNVIIKETLNGNQTALEAKLYQKATNPLNWDSETFTKDQRHYMKYQYKNLIASKGIEVYGSIVPNLMDVKFNELIHG